MFSRERGGSVPQQSPPSASEGGRVASDKVKVTAASSSSSSEAAAAGISRVDICYETGAVRDLNAMNENIRSLLEVDFPAYGITRPSSLVSLSLHSNRVSSLEGFSSLTALTALNLSSNELDGAAIRSCAPHLGGLSSLESLDLSCNRIDALLGLPYLPRLRRLLVPYNRLGALDGVQALASSLTYLDARENRIAGPTGTHAPQLAALGRLKNLVLASRGGRGRGGGWHSNPVCACRDYRRDIFAAARSLETLDGDAADGGGRESTTAAAGLGAGASASAEADATAVRARPSSGVGGAADWARNKRSAASRGPAHYVQQAEKTTAEAAAAAVAPEELLPRFEALADRFRRRHSRGNEERGPTLRVISDNSGRDAAGGGRGHAREKDDDDDDYDDMSSSMSSSIGDGGSSSSLRDGGAWSEEDGGGGKREGREGCGDGSGVFDRSGGGAAARKHHHHHEETAARAVTVTRRRGKRSGTTGDAKSPVKSVDGDAAAEENGLLSRLRSVAQEARLEVMDSRLQDLHVNADAARRAAAAAEAAAASRRGNLNPSRTPGGFKPGSHSRSNPWVQQRAAQPRAAEGKTVPRRRSILGTGSTTRVRGGSTAAVGDHPVRRTNAFEGVTTGVPSGDTRNGDYSIGAGLVPTVTAAAGPRPAVYFEEAPAPAASCPCCSRVQDASELMTLAAAEGEAETAATARGKRVLLLGESVRVGVSTLEVVAPKHVSHTSMQATRGPGATGNFRSTRRRLSARKKAAAGPGPGARGGGGGGAGGTAVISVGRAVAAAAVVGATAAAMSGFDNRRLAVRFLRWARNSDRAKAAAAAQAAQAALTATGEEAQRERQAWESLQATLEGSAAAREREAREAAEEAGRTELRSAAAARRSAEDAAAALTLQLAQAESETAAAMLGQQQAQAEIARVRAEAEASAAAGEAGAKAAAERLEEQLRAKARAESETEEECRRVRALLREAESRCRGLQDQVEESRARERRSSADAEDARRRAAVDADKKLAAAVDSERERMSALTRKLEAAQDAARAAAKAARVAAEGEAEGRRVATELAELARQQKAALQHARGEIGAARGERIAAQEAAELTKAEAARKDAEIKELGAALEAREAELGAERQARRRHQKEFQAAEARAEALTEEKEDAEAKAAAAAVAQGDLRAALMVKDKVLEDREKLAKELRLREGDALAEAQGWRDRLEAQQAEADHQLDAAREEVSELQAQVVALSGVEDQLREVFEELRRYRKRHEAEQDGNGDGDGQHREQGGVSSSSRGPRRGQGGPEGDYCATELTAVAAVTAAARAVEEELREQLEAKDEALRYVENELLGMKSLFEKKEACLRQALSEERDKLTREATLLRQRLELAEAGRTAAEEATREQAMAADTLRSDLQSGERRSKELEDTLRALLLKHTSQMAAAEATSQKLSKMAALFQQLQDQDGGSRTAVAFDRIAPSHGEDLSSSRNSGSGAASSTRG
ncbi:unnamed protein product [Pylaiella littoralis]